MAPVCHGGVVPFRLYQIFPSRAAQSAYMIDFWSSQIGRGTVSERCSQRRHCSIRKLTNITCTGLDHSQDSGEEHDRDLDLLPTRQVELVHFRQWHYENYDL